MQCIRVLAFTSSEVSTQLPSIARRDERNLADVDTSLPPSGIIFALSSSYGALDATQSLIRYPLRSVLYQHATHSLERLFHALQERDRLLHQVARADSHRLWSQIRRFSRACSRSAHGPKRFSIEGTGEEDSPGTGGYAVQRCTAAQDQEPHHHRAHRLYGNDREKEIIILSGASHNSGRIFNARSIDARRRWLDKILTPRRKTCSSKHKSLPTSRSITLAREGLRTYVR